MTLLRFGDFSLDTQNRVFRRGARVIAVQRKVLACLELFASRPGELIDERRLREQLWQGAHVSPEAVRRLIRETRRALGDRGDAQAWIRTRRGVGHVFLAPVTSVRGTREHVATTPEWPFVGRSAELALLRQALRGAAGTFCLISGEAGAGKSRLLRELRAAESLGRRWFVGHCLAGAEFSAFWPFREVLRQLLASAEYGRAVRAAIRREPQLSSLCPELARESPKHAASAAQRFDVCDALVRLLRRLSATERFAIVVEDVHWADDGTALLLEMLGRTALGGELDLLATCRLREVDGATPLGRALARTLGRSGVQNLELPPLCLRDIRSLVAAVCPDRDTLATAEAVQHASGGNPLFAEQLLKHRLASSGAERALPATLQQVVLARLAPLPRATRALLERAAVLGVEFQLTELSALAPRERDREQLLPALELGVVADARAGALAFSHALVRDALYDALAYGRRRQLHRDAMRALLRLGHSAQRSSALAEHAFLAGDVVPVQRTRRLCECAGRDAFAALAFDRAALHLGRALQLRGEVGSLRLRAELTLLWARARWHTGEAAGAVKPVFLQAAELARSAGATRLFAEAAIGFGVGEESVLDLDGPADRRAELALLREALQRVPASDRALRHRVARALCWLCEIEGDAAGAIEHAALALRCEPRPPDVWTRAVNLGMRLSQGSSAHARVIAECDALRRETRFTPRQRVELHLHAMTVSLLLGDMSSYAKSRRELELLAADLLPSRLERIGERLARCLLAAHVARATEAIVAGRFDEADDCLHEAFTRMRNLELLRLAKGLDQLQLPMQLLGYRGRRSALLPGLTPEQQETPSERFLCSIAHAECALERGDQPAAAAHFRALRATQFRRPLGSALCSPSRATLSRIGDLCARLGSAADAARLYASILPMAELCATDGVLVSFGSSARVLGELASTLGDCARAEQHLRAALAINQRAQHRPEHARALFALGGLLQRQGRGREARRYLRDARAEAAAMKLTLPGEAERR